MALALEQGLLVGAEAGFGLFAQHHAVDRHLVLQPVAVALGGAQPGFGIAGIEAQQQIPAGHPLALHHGHVVHHTGYGGFNRLDATGRLELALYGHGLGKGGQEGPACGECGAAGQGPDQHRRGATVLLQQHRLVEAPGAGVARGHQFSPSMAWLCTRAEYQP